MIHQFIPHFSLLSVSVGGGLPDPFLWHQTRWSGCYHLIQALDNAQSHLHEAPLPAWCWGNFCWSWPAQGLQGYQPACKNGFHPFDAHAWLDVLWYDGVVESTINRQLIDLPRVRNADLSRWQLENKSLLTFNTFLQFFFSGIKKSCWRGFFKKAFWVIFSSDINHSFFLSAFRLIIVKSLTRQLSTTSPSSALCPSDSLLGFSLVSLPCTYSTSFAPVLLLFVNVIYTERQTKLTIC